MTNATGASLPLRRAAGPPEGRALVSRDLRRLNEPVAPEFCRTETPSPDLRPQGVGGNPKARRGLLERQERHLGVSLRILLQLR